MLIKRLHECAESYPDKTAVISGTVRLNYSELYQSVQVFAAKLRKHGVGEGSFVCILLPNGVDFVIAFFAIAELKAIAVPLDPGLTRQELARYVGGLELDALISDSRWEMDSPVDCQVLQVTLDDEPDHHVTSEPWAGPVLSQFSSGSTGLPKRVIRTQYHLIQEYQQLSAAISVRSDDAVAAIVPLHHAHGFGNAMLLAICNGLTLLIPQAPRDNDGRELPLRFWRNELLTMLADNRITILPGVPFVFGLLAESSTVPEGLCLRFCVSAGSPLGEDVYRRFRERIGAPIRQLYGCTEAGSVTVNREHDIDSCWQSVGTPMPGIEIRLEDEENLVAFRSPAMAERYFGSATTAGNEAFSNGWFRPGDVGRIDERGCLYILGRRRPFIDSGGFKVDPLEVEQILSTHQHVDEVIVFGVPHSAVGEMIKAVVVPNKGAIVEKRELLDICSKQLAAYKQPRIIEIRESLPRSPLGKVLVRKLI